MALLMTVNENALKLQIAWVFLELTKMSNNVESLYTAGECIFQGIH